MQRPYSLYYLTEAAKPGSPDPPDHESKVASKPHAGAEEASPKPRSVIKPKSKPKESVSPPASPRGYTAGGSSEVEIKL